MNLVEYIHGPSRVTFMDLVGHIHMDLAGYINELSRIHSWTSQDTFMDLVGYIHMDLAGYIHGISRIHSWT